MKEPSGIDGRPAAGGGQEVRPGGDGRSRRRGLPPIRLMLVDDHPVFLEGLSRVLTRQADFVVVGVAAGGEEAIRIWERQRPDVLVLDLVMSGLDGLATLRRLRAAHPGSRVLILTSSDDPANAAAALEAGAAGYITKTARYDEIVAAIRAVHDGGRPLEGLAHERPAAAGPLTTREREVLGLLADGLTYAEIGRRLQITVRTARAHVAAVQQKLEATNNAQAVARAYQQGLLRPPDTPS